MSRVITYSRYFPAHHPKKGKPTHFVEQIYNSLYLMKVVPPELVDTFNFSIINEKHHTIRKGNRWKVGDKFSPRVWSGAPYRSKMITIATDIEIKKIYDIQIDGFMIWINKENRSSSPASDFVTLLAKNDGLSVQDFWNWFPQKVPSTPFNGQIICWNSQIEY